jgi:hypothetical protein
VTAHTLDTAPFAEPPQPRIQATYRRHSTAVARLAAFTQSLAVLLLGVGCTVTGTVFLLSLGIAIPVLTDEFSAWLKTSTWHTAPLWSVLTKMGYEPHFDGGLTGTAVNWLLSCETGVLIAVGAAAFGGTMWIFETSRSRVLAKPIRGVGR